MCVYIRVYSRLDFYIGAFKAKYNFELWPLHTHRCLIYQFFVCSIHYSHCSDSIGQKSGQSHLYALKWSKKDFTLLHIYFSNLLSEPNKLLLKMILNLITLLKHLFSKKYAHILLSPLPILAKDVKYIELRPIFQHRSKLYISCFEYAQS